VALGSFGMDSHVVQHFVTESGHANSDGVIWRVPPKPYGISYRSIIPRKGECENLFSPICVSASHVAHGSIRMEPVFMALSQSAAIAAGLALDKNLSVQDVAYEPLREKLEAAKQIVHPEALKDADNPNKAPPRRGPAAQTPANGATSSADPNQKPNIILIMADDLGYGDVSCYNDRAKVATPNLDRRAREALKPLPGTQPAPILYVSGDASGVPMRKEELQGRRGKQPDGSAKTRMGNLGCVFTQHHCDEQGHPVRDHESTTYVSTLQPMEKFGPLLRQEAIRRGLALALQVVLLVDGAEGLATMGRLCFPTAIQIVDFYHALEHAGRVLQALLGSKEHPEYKARLGRWARQLLKDKVQQLIAAARQECAGTSRASAVEKELGYFVRNVDRMQYGTFRSQGFFIGSGVIEAGCKTIIGARCKQSGMHWGEPGAENILAFRCIHASRRLDQFWKERLNSHAATNDCLALAE
jgi:hypothetical protein